ncbi:MAG: beta-N-acetylhexosaminidase [Alphaproteobacteria bacterium]|nr:beta-N-acetylhexosaminidase [Alphaproteobacteria bacterium]
MSDLKANPPNAAIFGCAGLALAADERAFFRDADPLGFILFQRNCEHPDQVRRLVDALRQSVGRADAPILIDQEGGRVARLKPPHWRAYPSAERIAALGAGAPEAARLVSRLIAVELAALGVTVDCLPVLDLRIPGADAVIGDRSYGRAPAMVAQIARAAAEGLLAGGVLPVVKHIPGHGRGLVDSHIACPTVSADRAELEAEDFAPFRALADLPWAMTAHIVYAAIDAERPATLSRRLVGEVIRGSIGFDGVLVSDDLSMQALGGGFADRAAGALGAGCDLVLHCNGKMDEMVEIAGAVGRLSASAQRRLRKGDAQRRIEPVDEAALLARFHALFGSA